MTDTDQAEIEPRPAEQLAVAFPASPTFSRIGRVAVVGLALRLGVEVSTVEKLRGAVDTAVAALEGEGRIDVTARWSNDWLEIALANPEVQLADPKAVAEELSAAADDVQVGESTVLIGLPVGRR